MRCRVWRRLALAPLVWLRVPQGCSAAGGPPGCDQAVAWAGAPSFWLCPLGFSPHLAGRLASWKAFPNGTCPRSDTGEAGSRGQQGSRRARWPSGRTNLGFQHPGLLEDVVRVLIHTGQTPPRPNRGSPRVGGRPGGLGGQHLGQAAASQGPSRAARWKLSRRPELLEASVLSPSGGLGMSPSYYSARQWACHLSGEDTSPLRMS